MNNNQTTGDETTADETTLTAPSAEVTSDAPESVTTADNTLDETLDAEPTDDDSSTAKKTIKGPIVVENSFAATGSTIKVEQGNTFSVSDNPAANISIDSCSIINDDAASVFLSIINSKTTLTLANQVVEGDTVLDGASSLDLVLSKSSYYMGTINGGNTSKAVSVTLDNTSQLILAGDSYISSLNNNDPTNMNIYSNGYKLYVAGEEATINGSEAPELPETVVEEEEIEEVIEEPANDSTGVIEPQQDWTPFIVGGIAVLVIILAIVVFVIHNKKKNDPTTPAGGNSTPNPFETGRPDFSQFDDGSAPQPGNLPPQESASPFNSPSPQPQNPTRPTPTSGPHPPLVGRM